MFVLFTTLQRKSKIHSKMALKMKKKKRDTIHRGKQIKINPQQKHAAQIFTFVSCYTFNIATSIYWYFINYCIIIRDAV